MSWQVVLRFCKMTARGTLKLQEAFGLRREEAIKFQPVYADRGDKVVLKSSWTKGGKAREIPVLNEHQRELLTQARNLVGSNALIPIEKSYIQQLKVYERHTARAGMSKLHGLRHLYAQQRYFDLTGRKAPANGGVSRSSLRGELRESDTAARMQISKELGHERLEVVAIYLGS